MSGAIVRMRLPSQLPCAQEFYGITLEALAEAKNDRLWFKTQLKLCSLWLRLREYSRATKLLKELHRRARPPPRPGGRPPRAPPTGGAAPPAGRSGGPPGPPPSC